MFRWLRAALQPTTYLGVGMIFVVWTTLVFLMTEDRARAARDAELQGKNLSRLLEENILRIITSIDQKLLLLRSLHAQDPARFKLANWVSDHRVTGDLDVRFSVIEADGSIRETMHGPMPNSIDVSDRDHFRIHKMQSEDILFISRPLITRTSGKTSIFLSRRLAAADGSFGGVITGALDPSAFAKFYDSIDLGRDGVVILLGFDGVVRATGRVKGSSSIEVGQELRPAQVFELYRDHLAQNYWDDHGSLDGIARLMSYRVVGEYPLISVLGVAKSQIFQQALRNERAYYVIGLILTALIVTAMTLGVIREMKLFSTTTELAQTNDWFNSALDHMSQGLVMFDANGRLIICNRQYPTMYALSHQQVAQGTGVDQLADHLTERGLYADVRGINPHGAPAGETSARIDHLNDGRSILISSRAMPSGGWVATHDDITERQRAADQIAKMARHDALTGLANRVLFLEASEAASVAMESGLGFFNILLLDLDRFKNINDSLGHAAGDTLLREVSQRLKRSIRTADVLARLGGDEFAIVQGAPRDSEGQHEEQNEQIEGAIVLANRILDAFNDPFELDGRKVFVGTSIGIALAPRDGCDPEELLKKADLALYETKSNGRNGYSFFNPQMTAVANERHQLEADMRAGLARDEFELHYQPIVDVRSREIAGMEALVRWRHPQHGLMLPNRFIPVAEDTELIVPLGERLIHRACRDAVSWPDHVKLAINLSAIQFRKGNLLDVILCALVDSGLSPDRLEVEITETVLLEKEAEHISTLYQLKNIGVSVALDDFGTGYSSLSYLKMFPFDKIKIDRSFTEDIEKRADCASIVCSVIGLGRSLNMITTAEGVETEEQYSLIRAAGVTLAQGHLFGMPRPVAELGLVKVGTERERQTDSGKAA